MVHTHKVVGSNPTFASNKIMNCIYCGKLLYNEELRKVIYRDDIIDNKKISKRPLSAFSKKIKSKSTAYIGRCGSIGRYCYDINGWYCGYCCKRYLSNKPQLKSMELLLSKYNIINK